MATLMLTNINPPHNREEAGHFIMKYSAVSFAILAVVGSSIVHGVWTDRWKEGAEPAVWAERLKEIPLKIGDWEGEELALTDEEVKEAQLAGYKSRRYVNKRTGVTLSVLIVCGRPGPVSIHPPDICYRGAGYVPGNVGKFALAMKEEKVAEFNMATFAKTNRAVPDYLTILWAWSAAGDWRAPSNPRFEYARYPALFKLYVIRQIGKSDEGADKDPARDFLEVYLSVLDELLFPKQAT
jgi:hypothetical protein